ncbi:hypothetical protein WDW37_18745 [Bdellovibrionota bacterium FG-1]
MTTIHVLTKIESELDRLLSLIPDRVKKNDTRIKSRMHQLRASLITLKEIIDPGRATDHDTTAEFDIGQIRFYRNFARESQ